MQPVEKILLISSNFPPVIGGSSVVYDQICRNAPGRIIALGASRDHDTGLLLNGTQEHDATCGYTIHRAQYLRPPRKFTQTGIFYRWAGFLFFDVPLMSRVLAIISRLVIQENVRIVCLGELVSLGWLVLPLRYLLSRNVIIYTHGEEVAQESGGFAARLRRFYLSHANGIISVSLFCKSLIVSRYRIDPAKIEVVANGVDVGRFSSASSDSLLPADISNQKIVLAVSRLVERKGLDRLIAAMPRVLGKVPNARCVIVGDGPLSDELANQIVQTGLQDRVTLAGKIAAGALVDVYRSADVFALPCRTLPDGDTEGFGLVFLEAGACGKPVVAGAAGGTIEAVIDGETGLVVDGSDPEEIAEAIIRILTDPPLAERLGEGGRKRAQTFTWSKATSAFLEFAACSRPRQQPAASYPSSGNYPAALPAMPARLLMTVDVEECFDWSKFSRRDHVVNGLNCLESFHLACRSLAISPVYLLTHSMLQEEGYRAWLRTTVANGEAEAGTHLHAWTTPPYWEEPNEFNSYQCNLPESIERQKLETLTHLYVDALGRRPLIHRAGRWGGAARTSRLLKTLGYRIDLSPSARYRDIHGAGPDFHNLDGRPFWSESEQDVLVLPASSLRFGRGPDWMSELRRRLASSRAEVSEIDGADVRFSPEGRTLGQLKSMARQFVRRDDPVVVVSLHSSSLVAGGNPYSPTGAAAAENLERTMALLTYCTRVLGMQAATCASVLAEAQSRTMEGESRKRSVLIGSDISANAPGQS